MEKNTTGAAEARACDVLLRRCKVENEPPVASLLNANPFLSSLALEGVTQLRKTFGERSDVVLRVIEEVDAPEDRELWAVVQTSMEPPEAIQRLKTFDTAWWRLHSSHAQGLLNFGIEYV